MDILHINPIKYFKHIHCSAFFFGENKSLEVMSISMISIQGNISQ